MKKFFRLVSVLALAGLTLTYTSCTDYSEDIDKTNDRVDDLQSNFDAFKDATDKSIKSLQDLVAILETKEDHQKDVDDLNKLIADLNSSVGAIEKDLPNYVKKTDLATELAKYVKLSDYNTKIGEIEGRLEKLEGKYDSNLKISEIISQITAAQEKANTVATDLASLKSALGVYAEAGKLDEKIKALEAEDAKKLNIADFKAKFTEEFEPAFKTAIEASCKEGGEVYNKVFVPLNKSVNELQSLATSLNTKINQILGIVGSLANRIQSITFVPEYDDFCASLYYYYLIGEKDKVVTISDKTVVASFEVYPANQAARVAKMLNAGEGASIVAVPLKEWRTRGAAATTVKGAVKSATADGAVVKVVAVFGDEVNYYDSPKEDEAVSFAISLRVEDPDVHTVDKVNTVKDGEAVADSEAGKTVDAGKYIESDYIPVELSGDCNLNRSFDIYNFTTKKAYEDATTQHQWSNAPEAWNYFEGYEYAVMIRDYKAGEKTASYKTLAQAAEIMNVEVADITPVLTVKAVADPKANAKFFNSKVDFTTLAEANIAMDKAKVDADVENAVGSKLTHTASFALKGVEGVIADRSATYEIIRRQVDFNVTPQDKEKVVAWSYAKAVELSSAKTKTAAYDKNIVFNECQVDEIVGGVSLSELLKTKVSEYYKDGVKVTGKAPIKISKVSEEITNIAKVVIPGKTYEFTKGEDHTCEIVSKYIVKGNVQTDYNVKFTYTLGAMADDQTVTLPVKPASKFEAGKDIKVEYTADEYRKPLVDAIGSYFKDAATLWASVNEDECTKTYVRKGTIDGKADQDLKGATSNLNVSNAGVNAVIARSDIKTFGDKFKFETKHATWYGVDYTFKTNGYALEIAKPAFALVPAPDRLNADWTGTILHENKYDKYVLQQDIDLSKYVNVANYDGKETTLTIGYVQKTTDNNAMGILRAPKINTTPVKVVPNAAAPKYPTIDPSLINWLTKDRATSFTARYDEVEATLYFDGIKLDNKLMKLSTARPITKFEFANFDVNVNTDSKKVNLWSNMTIEGVLEAGNIVKTDATSLSGALYRNATGKKSTASTYDAEVIFPAVKDVEVYVGGEKQDIYNLEKFTYDPANGTITFTGDLADLVKPVEFRFNAQLNYVLDYNHVDKLTAPVSVTFKK